VRFSWPGRLMSLGLAAGSAQRHLPVDAGSRRRLAVAYCLVMAARTAGWNLRMNVQMLQRACQRAGAGAAAVTEGECPPDTVAIRRAQIEVIHG